MPIIYELIKTLNTLELENVSALKFQERERAVFNKMLQTKSAVFPSSTICKSLNLQSSHLDKINSILLRKAIECLVGDDIYEQVNYFDRKNGLWNASARLLKQHEQKVILQSINKKDKLRFYTFFFEWLINTSGADYNEKDLEKYAVCILENCPKPTLAETSLWIRILLLRNEINEAGLHTVFTNPEQKDSLFSKLQISILEADAIQSPPCVFRAKLNAIKLYNMFQQYDESVMYFNEITQLMNTHHKEFTELDGLIAQWHYAQILFFSDKKLESFEIFKSLYGNINKNDTARWYIYTIEYFQVSLATSNYTQAEEIYDAFLHQFFSDRHGKFYISSLIQYVKYLFHRNKLEEAKIKIADLHKAISKNSSLQFQFAVRELTAVNYYLDGAYEEALLQADKNLKFMRGKRIHLLLPEHTYHSRLIKSIIKHKTKNTSLDADDEKMFAVMQKGTLAQYGILLKRLRDN